MKTTQEYSAARRVIIALLLLLLIAMACLRYPLPVTELQLAPFRILSELACAVLFFSIFIVSWHGYAIHHQSRSVILALGFLCAAIFNFFSIASETATPHFSGTDYQQTALLFSLLWRGLTAIILLFIASDTLSKDRNRRIAQDVLRTMLCAITLLSILVILYYDKIPSLTDHSSWSYQTLTYLEITLIVLFLAAAWLTYLQPQSVTEDVNEKSHLLVACATLAMAEFCFSQWHAPHVLLNIVGQIYQLIAAYCIYTSLVTISLRTPLAQLAQARFELLKSRNRLTGIIQTATDGIITVNASHQVILVNRAAEEYFAYPPGQMLGQHLDAFIPMRHRAGHNKHVDQFGKTGTTIRQMGVASADFSVTGLKLSGEEFPIEASISSLTEGDQRFFTVIFRDITERKIAREKMELVHRELSELSQSLQSVREEERKHIARELHDDLGQLLAALRMDLSVLEKRLPDNPTAKPILVSMNQLVLTAIATLRRIATDLRPRALDEGGLYFALQSLQKEFRAHHMIECELSANENDLILNDDISTMVFRVIQESLTNVARHARASEVHIQLERQDNTLTFKVIDNGRGISEQDYSKRQSFGLVGMRERVRALQGELTVSKLESGGTCVAVVMPLPAD